MELAEELALLGLVPAELLEQEDCTGEAATDPELAPDRVLVVHHRLDLILAEGEALMSRDLLLVNLLAVLRPDHLDLDVLPGVRVVAGFHEQPVVEQELLDAQAGHLGGISQTDPAVTALAVTIAATGPKVAGHERQLDRNRLAELAPMDLACPVQVRTVRLADEPALAVVFEDETDDSERLRAEEKGIIPTPQVRTAQNQPLGMSELVTLPGVGRAVELTHHPHPVRDEEGVVVALLFEVSLGSPEVHPEGLAPPEHDEVVARQSGHLPFAVTVLLDKPTASLSSRAYAAR